MARPTRSNRPPGGLGRGLSPKEVGFSEAAGLGELKLKFQKLSKGMQRKAMREAIRKAATPVVTRARKEIDVRDRTGFLRKNIAMTVTASGTIAIALIGMRRKAFYGAFFELGTYFFKARPWLRPALIKSKNLVIERFARGLKTGINKAIR